MTRKTLIHNSHKTNLYNFVQESNLIEGINRFPTKEELREAKRFMLLQEPELIDVLHFVEVFQSGAELRNRPGLNVTVGNHVPPAGDITIKTRLLDILNDAAWSDDPYEIHQRYESLHPFTDCNGRSGRMLWAWMMGEFPLGFLHTWYYQSLDQDRKARLGK